MRVQCEEMSVKVLTGLQVDGVKSGKLVFLFEHDLDGLARAAVCLNALVLTSGRRDRMFRTLPLVSYSATFPLVR